MANNNSSKPEEGQTNAPSTPPTNPPDTSANDALEARKREKELAEREAVVKAAEERVAAAEKRIDDKLQQMDDALAKVARSNDPEEVVLRLNEQKVAIVHKLQRVAYADQEVENDRGEMVPVLSDMVEYTPRVNLANITQAGVIGYEKGLTYKVPRAIKEDLTRREAEHLDYRENLHVRNEDVIYAGKISGGGK